MTYEDAKLSCHVRSAIYREAHPAIRYWKNHSTPLDDRVPDDWKAATDWEEYDPRNEMSAGYHALED